MCMGFYLLQADSLLRLLSCADVWIQFRHDSYLICRFAFFATIYPTVKLKG